MNRRFVSGHRSSFLRQSQGTLIPRRYDRYSIAANPIKLIYRSNARAAILRYGEGREHCPVADFKLLIDVMEVLFDSTVSNIQPASNFLIRQPFGHQTHDLSLTICEYAQGIFGDGNV